MSDSLLLVLADDRRWNGGEVDMTVRAKDEPGLGRLHVRGGSRAGSRTFQTVRHITLYLGPPEHHECAVHEKVSPSGTRIIRLQAAGGIRSLLTTKEGIGIDGVNERSV